MDDPEGATIRVLAAPLNPIDLATSRGVLAAGHPELPYVPGCEAVGTTAEGRLVWIFGGGLGTVRNGAMAERAAIGAAHAIEVPEGADPALAAALGIAGLAGWLPFAWRAPLRGGENVLVLGATGTVGIVAVQSAKLLGAARVIAAGRNPAGLERASSAGADATVRLDESDDLAAAFREAFGGEGPSYVFDPLWGAPAAAAVQAAVPGATIVNLGQSAGATSELASAAVRFKSLNSSVTRTSLSPPMSWPSTTAVSSGTPSQERSGSTSSRSRSTTRRTHGGARQKAAPARSSSSYRASGDRQATLGSAATRPRPPRRRPRRRRSRASSIAATATSEALPRYATWKPSTSACAWSAGCGCAAEAVSVSSVLLAANVERMASPSAPPTCCDVL